MKTRTLKTTWLMLLIAALVTPATVAGQIVDRAASALKPQQTEGAQTAPSDFDAYFSGTIGQHAIEANISRRGTKLEGQYFYVSTRAARQRQYLSLDGEVRAGENFTLHELDQQNQKTGIFKGRIVATRKAGTGIRLDGYWSKSDAANAPPTLMFSLSETTLTLNGQTLRSQTKQISEENLQPKKYAIAVEYPEFTATADGRQLAAVNREVLDLALKEVSAFKADVQGWDTNSASENQESSLNIEHHVTTPADGLVSISFRVDTYFAGAAHPNHRSSMINFDLRSGRQLKLADLFRSPSNYLQEIARLCMGALKKDQVSDDEWLERGAGPQAENYKSWSLTRSGLLVTFDPYSVASYAEGTKEVIIPFAALRNLINSQGPLAQLAK